MGSISIPAIGAFISAYGGTIAAGAAVAAGAATAIETRQAGVAASKEDRDKARIANDNAAQQQIQMRQKLLAGLASQNAQSLGAVGTGGASSFGANTMRQITQQQNDLMVSQASASANVSLLDSASTNASQIGSSGAVGAGLTGIGQGVNVLAKMNPGTTS